jgi:hypothetical protein
MQFLSLMVLILLSLAAYSAGAAAKAGKRFDIKPQLVDLALVVLIWAAAVSTRASWHMGRWRLVAVWAAVSGLTGFAAASLRKLPAARSGAHEAPRLPVSAAKRIWRVWTDFSRRMGGFQSRVLLSFFFFIVVTPFALLVKVFSDPLRIKRGARKSGETYWLPKKEVNAHPDEFRRQF